MTGSGGKAPPPTAPNPRTYSNGKPGISMQKLKNRPNTETQCKIKAVILTQSSLHMQGRQGS